MTSAEKQRLRDLFPVTRNLTYFNHAAVGSLSTRACEAMERQARDHRDLGALHWREWYAIQDAAREKSAKLIGARTGEIALLKNTSEGLAFVAEGYRWRAGENVVTTAVEFPPNMAPWKNLARRGVETRIARSLSIDDIEPLIDAKTRIVTVSSVAFHNGATADLASIGELCAQRGVLLCVDAIQSVGVLPIDVHRSGIAFLAADAHKWICGPEGAAMFFVAEEHRDRLDVLEYGWTNVVRPTRSYFDAPAALMADSRRFEAGTVNTNGVAGQLAAVELILEIGIETIAAETTRLANRLADGLSSAGFRIGSPRPIRSGIVGACVDDPHELMRLHGALEKERIICAPREGMLRFSPHYYNDDDEVDRVVDVLRSLAATRG